MKIIAIDPGQSTGLVVAKFLVSRVCATIHIETALTIGEPTMVYAHAYSSNARLLVMEDKPTYGNPVGLEPWNKIFSRLEHAGYKVHERNHDYQDSSGKSIFFISPSQWKPFMTPRKYIIKDALEKFPKATVHVQDAAALLYYFIQKNHPRLEIFYV
jgi:hypothetical protein